VDDARLNGVSRLASLSLRTPPSPPLPPAPVRCYVDDAQVISLYLASLGAKLKLTLFF
jgi:hypothetical protein